MLEETNLSSDVLITDVPRLLKKTLILQIGPLIWSQMNIKKKFHIIKNLKVINDSKTGNKIIINYSNIITKDEE